jgi:LysR family transcriptional regulator, low CO2-responsive transcriptional regulator
MKEKFNDLPRAATLKQLRAFAAVIRHGTYTAAAEKLFVTPPAVSIQLGLLEDLAGLPLFERVGETYRATGAGEELMVAVRTIEEALSECGEAIDRLKGTEGGQVRVGIVSTAKYFAPRALARFAHENPAIDVRLSIGNRQETIDAIDKHEIDFAVMGRSPEEFAVAAEIFGDHPHIIIGPPDHPLAGVRNIPIKKLADEKFLSREVGSGTRNLTNKLFQGVGIEPVISMEIGSNETIKQAVMAGLGVALISGHTVAVELADGRLTCLDIKGMPLVRNWSLVRREEKRMLPAAQALWDFMIAEGEGFLPRADPDQPGSTQRI